eukprot:2810152-Rhodomonas_salina.4
MFFFLVFFFFLRLISPWNTRRRRSGTGKQAREDERARTLLHQRSDVLGTEEVDAQVERALRHSSQRTSVPDCA